MSDCFEEIHHLLREQQDESVLEKVLDTSKMTINPPYDCDLNHAWYIIGDIYFSARKYKLSVQAFENSIIDSDEDTDAYLALANLHSKLGHHERARDVLLSALTKNPNDARLRFNLGNAFFDLGDNTNAIANYESLIGFEHNSLERLALSNLRKIRKIKKPNGPKTPTKPALR